MKIKYALYCTLIVLIILIGCHLDATYTMHGTIESVNGNEVFFLDETENIFSCTITDSSPNLKKGDEYILKFSHKGTESDRFDDGLIDFGKHCFCGIVF